MNNVFFSKKTDEWYTPIDLFNSLHNEFNFTLDPCATKSRILCDKNYFIEDNGLNFNWNNEIVFCNPPYSKISEWVKYSYYQWRRYNITIVLLIPVRTDTKYFHDYILPYAEIRFIKGRLKFSNKGSAPFPSMICIFKGGEKIWNV